MHYFIGADLGTSALKLLLCEQGGAVLASVTKEYSVSYPRAGWAEQDPKDWWEAFWQGVRELTANVDRSKIVGIGVAGQMHGLVMLDGEDRVIRPAILWNDGRCAEETEYLNGVIGKDALTDMTGNIAFAGFTAPKVLWVRRHEPAHFLAAKKIMLPKDYINYRLTGVHACDFSDASGTLLLDVKNKCWSSRMLELCGLRSEQMPRLFESYEPIGRLTDEAAETLGLARDTVVTAGAADNAAAAIGMGTVLHGACNLSLGTSGTVFVASDTFVCDRQSALHYFCHASGGYHVLGCMLSAASCNQWFCDRVLQTRDYGALQAHIREEKLGRNAVYFLPYLMGERSPINDTDATGCFIGLRPDTAAEDMLLAVLEGVAFALRDNLENVRRMGVRVDAATVCGGGAKSELWLWILANVLNVELSVPENEEGPALGAAYLASVAVGDRRDFSALGGRVKRRVCPEEELASRYAERYKKFQKIYPHLKTLFQEIME